MDSLPTRVRQAVDAWWHRSAWAGYDYAIDGISATGLSSASVYHIHATHALGEMDGFALKRWGWKIDRKTQLETILDFQQSLHLGLQGFALNLAENQPFVGNEVWPSAKVSIVPEVLRWHGKSSICESQEELWTLSPWMPGMPLPRGAEISDALLDQAVWYLAKIHQLGSKIATCFQIPGGINLRHQRLATWMDGSLRRRCEYELPASVAAIVRRTLPTLDPLISKLQPRMRRCLASPQRCHWIVGDLWRENVLVRDGWIRGIIDFGAARVDWPLLELVRWLGSWLTPKDHRIENALHRYQEFRTSTPSQRQERTSENLEEPFTIEDFRFVDQLSTSCALLQWLHWSVDHPVEAATNPRIHERMQELADRLQCLHCEDLATGS